MNKDCTDNAHGTQCAIDLPSVRDQAVQSNKSNTHKKHDGRQSQEASKDAKDAVVNQTSRFIKINERMR